MTIFCLIVYASTDVHYLELYYVSKHIVMPPFKYILFVQAFVRIAVKEKAWQIICKMYNMPGYNSNSLWVVLSVSGKYESKNVHWEEYQAVIRVVSHREFLT